MANRLTDEAWREMLRTGDAPERPSWEVLAGWRGGPACTAC